MVFFTERDGDEKIKIPRLILQDRISALGQVGRGNEVYNYGDILASLSFICICTHELTLLFGRREKCLVGQGVIPDFLDINFILVFH